VQEHDSLANDQLLVRLFVELFPAKWGEAMNACSHRLGANMKSLAISDTRFPIFEMLLVFFDH
jgi:hypothetical protein